MSLRAVKSAQAMNAGIQDAVAWDWEPEFLTGNRSKVATARQDVRSTDYACQPSPGEQLDACSGGPGAIIGRIGSSPSSPVVPSPSAVSQCNGSNDHERRISDLEERLMPMEAALTEVLNCSRSRVIRSNARCGPREPAAPWRPGGKAISTRPQSASGTARVMRPLEKQMAAGSGFDATQLRDAGFDARELKDAGFSALQLKCAGFTAKDLKVAGFSAAQMGGEGNAGFSAPQLKDAGFSATQLKYCLGESEMKELIDDLEKRHQELIDDLQKRLVEKFANLDERLACLEKKRKAEVEQRWSRLVQLVEQFAEVEESCQVAKSVKSLLVEKFTEVVRETGERRGAAQAKADAEQVAKAESERNAKAKAEQQAKEDAQRKAKADAEQVAKAESERNAKAKAEEQVKVESQRRAAEDAEKKAGTNAGQSERKAKEEVKPKVKGTELEAEAAKAQAEGSAKETAEQHARTEAQSRAKEDSELKAQAEAERLAKEEAERKAKLESETVAKGEVEKSEPAPPKRGEEVKSSAAPQPPPTQAQPSSLASGLKGGDGFLELGQWRVGVYDDAHFSFSHKDGKTCMIFRSDGTSHPGPRTDFGLWKKPVGETKNVLVGEQLLEFGGSWRLGIGDVDGKHCSLSHKGGKTAMIWRFDGTQHPGDGKRQDFSTWKRPLTPSKVKFGDGFLVLGDDFRVGDVNGGHMSVGNAKSKKTNVIYRKDGTVHPGPRADLGLWDRSVLGDAWATEAVKEEAAAAGPCPPSQEADPKAPPPASTAQAVPATAIPGNSPASPSLSSSAGKQPLAVAKPLPTGAAPLPLARAVAVAPVQGANSLPVRSSPSPSLPKAQALPSDANTPSEDASRKGKEEAERKAVQEAEKRAAKVADFEQKEAERNGKEEARRNNEKVRGSSGKVPTKAADQAERSSPSAPSAALQTAVPIPNKVALPNKASPGSLAPLQGSPTSPAPAQGAAQLAPKRPAAAAQQPPTQTKCRDASAASESGDRYDEPFEDEG